MLKGLHGGWVDSQVVKGSKWIHFSPLVNYRDYFHCHKLVPGTDIGQLLCLGFQMGGHDTSVRSEIIDVPCLTFYTYTDI